MDRQKKRDRSKEYYKKNREEIIRKSREYRKNNIRKGKEYQKEYYQRPEVKKRKKEYRLRTEIKIKTNLRHRDRYSQDKNFNIRLRLSALMRHALNIYTKAGKIKSSSKYGIDYQKIIEHLKPFPEDISSYHVDHIKPLCIFDLTDPEEIKKAFSPENHQWLLASENMSKGGKYEESKLS